jgi:hypothetical protein
VAVQTTVNIFRGMGNFSELAGAGTTASVLAGEYVDVTVTHADFVQLGDLTVTAQAGFTATIVEHHRSDSFVVRFTNNASYDPATCAYSWRRTGRLLQSAT